MEDQGLAEPVSENSGLLGAADSDAPPEVPWLLADSCCGCCDLQTGTKIIAIMGIIQGLTSCMAIGTAGFLSMPTLLVGVLSIGFGLYGFWGAHKFDPHKTRIHCYWLMTVILLYVGMSIARMATANQFCMHHNCVLETTSNVPTKAGLPAGKYVEGSTLLQEGASFKTKVDLTRKADHISHAQNAKQEKSKPVPHPGTTQSKLKGPIYLDPCYLRNGLPAVDLCTKAHQLSAIATMAIAVPMNVYFAFIVYSFHVKVDLAILQRPAQPVPARPVQIAGQIPPMSVYNAAGLDGAPVVQPGDTTGGYMHDVSPRLLARSSQGRPQPPDEDLGSSHQ